MNSKWGNSLAIVTRNMRSAWRAILSGYLGSYIQEPEGGGSSRGVSAFCVDKLDKLVTRRPPRPPWTSWTSWLHIVHLVHRVR